MVKSVKISADAFNKINDELKNQTVGGGEPLSTDPTYPVFRAEMGNSYLAYVPRFEEGNNGTVITGEDGTEVFNCDEPNVWTVNQGGSFHRVRSVKNLTFGDYDGTDPLQEVMFMEYDMARKAIEIKESEFGAKLPEDQSKAIYKETLSKLPVSRVQKRKVFPALIIPTDEGLTKFDIDNAGMMWIDIAEYTWEQKIENSIKGLDSGLIAGNFMLITVPQGKGDNAKRDAGRDTSYTLMNATSKRLAKIAEAIIELGDAVAAGNFKIGKGGVAEELKEAEKHPWGRMQAMNTVTVCALPDFTELKKMADSLKASLESQMQTLELQGLASAAPTTGTGIKGAADAPALTGEMAEAMGLPKA